MNKKKHVKTHEKRQGRKQSSKIFLNNQIITTCHIKLQVQEMTMNEKLTMTGLNIWIINKYFKSKLEHFLCFIYMLLCRQMQMQTKKQIRSWRCLH